MLNKLLKANRIVQAAIKGECPEGSWRYIDFVECARFFDEVKQDKDISVETMTHEEIAEHCLEKIFETAPIEFGQYMSRG